MSDQLTDEHYEWTARFTGKDPRQSEQATAAPATPEESNQGFFGKLGDLASGALNAVEDTATGIAGGIRDAAVTVGRGIETAGTAIEGAAVTAGTAIEETAVTVGRGIEHAAEAAGTAIEGAAVTAGTAIKDAAVTVGRGIEDAAAATGTAIKDAVVGAEQAVAGAIGGVIDAVEDAVGHGPKAAKAQAAADTVTKTSDADLKKMSNADKVKLLNDLEGNGDTSGDVRAAQRKIFQNMELDPGFKQRDLDRADKIADELKDDPELKAAKSDWGGQTDTQKVNALKKVLAAHCKSLGMPMPDVIMDHQPPKDGRILNGLFDGAGKLHLNLDPASDVSTGLDTAIDTMIHENCHQYQRVLVQQLNDGKLKPGDPDYEQATIFAANSGNNYIQPEEDPTTLDPYIKQPEENHSRTIGGATAKIIVNKL